MALISSPCNYDQCWGGDHLGAATDLQVSLTTTFVTITPTWDHAPVISDQLWLIVPSNETQVSGSISSMGPDIINQSDNKIGPETFS